MTAISNLCTLIKLEALEIICLLLFVLMTRGLDENESAKSGLFLHTKNNVARNNIKIPTSVGLSRISPYLDRL